MDCVGYIKKKMFRLQESFLVANGLIPNPPNWFAYLPRVLNQTVSKLSKHDTLHSTSLKTCRISGINIV
jgi:hypothetical protein